MATSSRGGLGQWQRIVSILKDHLSAKGKRSVVTPVAGNEVAALQALDIYLHQIQPQPDNDNDANLNGLPLVTDKDSTTGSRLPNPLGHLRTDRGRQVTNSAPISRANSPGVHLPINRAASPIIGPTYSTIKIPTNYTKDQTVKNTNIAGQEVSTIDTSTSLDLSNNSSVLQTNECSTPSGDSASITQSTESEIQKALRTVNSYIPTSLSQVNSYIPSSLSQVNLSFLRKNSDNKDPSITKEKDKQRPLWLDKKRDVVSKASVDSRTRNLLRGINVDNGEAATLRRLEVLSSHLRFYPHTKGAAIKCGGLGNMLQLLSQTRDNHVANEARVVLGLLGYTGSVGGRGLRVLTIDGGGVRGLVALEMLRKLEKETGQPVHEMFDLICGVSTGAIVAVLVGSHRLPLPECEQLYRELSEKVFTQTTFKGATGLVINNSYYDSQAWDGILQDNMGESQLLDDGARQGAPRLCLVASHAVRSVTQAYLFRNYVLPYRVASRYSGTAHAKMWQAVRASAAAPGYFSEFLLDNKVLLDGGILVNNPAAIAVHEARLLWPDEPFQCVVSLGTGRCQPIEPGKTEGANWSDKLRSVINSATDTEGVHTILHDLLPGHVYFRFNPHLSDDFVMDEIRPERLAMMMEDTQFYTRKNTPKFREAALALTKEKTHYHKARDAFKRAKIVYGWDIEG